MKGLYVAPELEIVKFLNEDILTATPELEVGDGDVDPVPDEDIWN